MKHRQESLVMVLPLIVLTLLAWAIPTLAQIETTPKPQGIDGRVIAETACASCHSTMMIQSARKNRTNWLATIKKMEKNGMAQLPDQFVTPLLDYLEANMGEPQSDERPIPGPWAGSDRVNPLWK